MMITTEQIKALRQETGAGILDCRKALEQADGDHAKAVENLRAKGLAKAALRADREVLEGVLELYSHGNGRVGVIVELNCETDFVSRSEPFRYLAHEIALQIAAASPRFIRPEDITASVLEKERQEARLKAVAEGKPEAVIERIVAGRLEKFIDEVCLLRQPYIRDENMTVADLLHQNIASLGENVVIRRFARWEVGEEIAS